jgi:SAM-dependent methyltransferase
MARTELHPTQSVAHAPAAAPPPAVAGSNTEPSPRQTSASEAPGYGIAEPNVALCRAIGRPRNVLDVGCGIGLNGQVARGRGARVVGIELHEAARRIAATRLDEVLSVDLEHPLALREALGHRRFDLILCGDVLEHLRDPLAVLMRLLEHLDEEGRVVVSLPNIASWTMRLELLGGRFDYEPSGILDRTHLRFFTRASAEALLRDAGLELLSLDANPMLVRALAKPVVNALGLAQASDPTKLARSYPFAAYQSLVRPVEDLATRLRPELLAFQHVFVARRPTRPRPLRLTIGMLTMNEEPSIAPMIEAIRREAPDAELVVVDSSTKDRTAEIARELGAVVRRQVPASGHGPAMELLMYAAAAKSDALIYLDCDFTYPPRMIPELRRLLEEEGVDVVNCARTRAKPAAMPWPNYLANRSFAAMAHALHGVPTVDVHSGMRAYRSSVIRAFDFDGEGDALPIDTLLWPVKRGYRVVELPIDYDDRVGDSKLRKLSGTAWTFVRLLRTLPVGRRGGRYERR